MIINSIACPYVISKFEQHSRYKDLILELLDTADFEHAKFDNIETDITKTDWFLGKSLDRKWVKPIIDPLVSHTKNVYSRLGYETILIRELWFQQYHINSQHGWHVHSSNFTNVYYLEMSKESPKTLLLNPLDQTQIIELDCQEGDVVSFPSFIIHKSPKNVNKQRKTIISYNLDVNYSEQQYQKDLDKQFFAEEF